MGVCWYQKPEKNMRETQDNCPKREKCEKMFLYYTIRWVKTQAKDAHLMIDHIGSPCRFVP